MLGYLRRKVTYNVGRGGTVKSAPSRFKANQPNDDTNVSACIIEPDNRLFYVDIGFARKGAEEGWLKIDGWHREGPLDEVIVYRYRMIRRTVNY